MSIDIPNYRIHEKLGIGAQSQIFRARCMRTGKDYAVKVVKVHKPEDNDFVELLKAEYAIGSAINHPVIRKVYELRNLRHRLRFRGAILFMEYVDGMPMSDREFRRPMDEVLRIFAQTADGLAAMHNAGYVHADLKPSNILVTRDGAVKLIDLGQSAQTHMPKTRIQGTIHYMAPEQAQKGTLNPRTDVFGLGATMHHVFTGRPILTEMNQNVSMHAQGLVGKKISEIRHSAIDELPKAVALLIERCCQTNPDDRIANMPELVERIELVRTALAKYAQTEVSLEHVDVVAEDEDDLDRTDVFPFLDPSSESSGV